MSESGNAWREAQSNLTIPGYELREEIGRGGMGVVYRARDLGFERDVAIKVLGEKVGADSFSAARFRNEARITGQLQHPGIPAAHELGVLTDGKPFLAMKLVRGATLQAMLDQRSSPSDERGKFIAIFEQICHAVGYAHAHQVIHRDLKPSNVMVGKFGEVQIMDWGLAKVLGESREDEDATEIGARATEAYVSSAIETPAGADSATRTGSVLGTPAYMSPEQAGGQIRLLDARSDVFGLGSILCEILTGQPPYGDKNPNEVRIKAVRGDLKGALEKFNACGAEPDLVALAKKCLAFKQAERPADGQAVAQDVARIRTQAEARARQAELARSAALVREAEGAKRRRQFLIAASAIGAMLVLGIVGTSYGLYFAQQAAGAEAQAKKQAKEKQKEAEEERTRAEEREQDAIDAVKRFGDAVAKNPELKNSERLKSLRRELLKEPLAFFKSLRERLQQEKNTRPEMLSRLAMAAKELGTLTSQIGDKQDALRAYEEAIAILVPLVKSDPQSVFLRVEKAKIYHDLGGLLKAIGKAAEAQQAYEKSMEVFKQLVGEQPASAEFRSLLATTHCSLGLLLRDLDRPDDALRELQVSKEMRQSLAEENKGIAEIERDLATSCGNLAILFHGTGKWEEAKAAYEEAKERFSRLAKERPHVNEHQSDLANAYTNLAVLQTEMGRPETALDGYQEARKIFSDLVERNPSDTVHQYHLAWCYQQIGSHHAASGERAEALIAYREARRIGIFLVSESPTDMEFRDHLARTYYNIGLTLGESSESTDDAVAAYEEAKRLDEELVTRRPDSHEFQSHLGTTLHNLARLKLQDGKSAEAKEMFEKAIVHQKNALAKKPEDPRYREHLLNHYSTLISTADALRDFELAIKTRQEMWKFNSSDPLAAKMDQRLAAVLGGAKPNGAEELTGLGLRAYHTGRFGMAVKVYATAIEQFPELAEDRQSNLLFNGACNAALAVSGQSNIEAPLDDAARAQHRTQALSYLQRDLDYWRKFAAEQPSPEAQQRVVTVLQHWQRDSDLECVREMEKLAALSAAERKEWEGFWARVKELLAKLQGEANTEGK